jgi:hypothetical protein
MRDTAGPFQSAIVLLGRMHSFAAQLAREARVKLPSTPDYGARIDRSDPNFAVSELSTLREQLRDLSNKAQATFTRYLQHPVAGAKATALLSDIEQTAAELGPVLANLEHLETESTELSRSYRFGAAIASRQTEFVTGVYEKLLAAIKMTH